jgi:hypothetical protein
VIKIADAHETNYGVEGGTRTDIVYAVTSDFADTNIDPNQLHTTQDNLAAASLLDAFAAIHDMRRQILVTDSNGFAHFGELLPGMYLVSQHEEEESDYLFEPYLVSVPEPLLRDVDDRVVYKHDVIAYPKTALTRKEAPTIQITAHKVWKGSTTYPTSVKVQLYQDGKAYGDPITLNANNYWKHTWEYLSKEYIWTVDEPEVPANYEKSVAGNQTDGFIVTNTYKTDKPPVDPPVTRDPIDGPKTGDSGTIILWVMLGSCGLAGLVFMIWVLKPRRSILDSPEG